MAERKRVGSTADLKLPKYIECQGKGVVRIDPDLAYPAFLEELKALGEVTIEVQIPGPGGKGPTESVTLRYEGPPDQYWLEVCYNFAKLDCVFWCTLLQLPKVSHRVIRGKDPGYKTRWARVQHTPGRMAQIEERFGRAPEGGTYSGPLPQAEAQVRREARQLYKRLRGVLPGMTMV